MNPQPQEPTHSPGVTSTELLDATVIIEADADTPDFLRRVRAVLDFQSTGLYQILAVCLELHRNDVDAALASHSFPLNTISLPNEDAAHHLNQLVAHVRAERVAFLPAGISPGLPQWRELTGGGYSLMPWTPDTPLPEIEWYEEPRPAGGWIASTSLLRAINGLGPPSNWELMRVASAARREGVSVTWPSPQATLTANELSRVEGHAPLDREAAVLALVPHYRCEEWLAECLEGLVMQSHPLSGIVVIDDGSVTPPTEIVRAFPQVTLLSVAENVGAYRLLQQVIDETSYDAYLMQDADDWSTYNRLEILLADAERSGAEIVGGQELRITCEDGKITPVCYARDVNAALRAQPDAFCLLNGTSLIGRNLLQRLGGLATGVRFAADMEFVARATHVARIVNVSRYCYFRRYRTDSVTGALETGHSSPLRQKITSIVNERARSNAVLAASGKKPDLRPLAVAEPVRLAHLCGPALKPSPTR